MLDLARRLSMRNSYKLHKVVSEKCFEGKLMRDQRKAKKSEEERDVMDNFLRKWPSENRYELPGRKKRWGRRGKGIPGRGYCTGKCMEVEPHVACAWNGSKSSAKGAPGWMRGNSVGIQLRPDCKRPWKTYLEIGLLGRQCEPGEFSSRDNRIKVVL